MRKNDFSIHRFTRTRKPQVLDHLLRLDPQDRRLRFGIARSGHDLARYVAALDDTHDIVLGAVTSSGELLGVAHVAVAHDVAELGLSVDRRARRRGIGLALARRALVEASGGGAREFRFDCAASNAGMRAIAERLAMQFERDGAEVIARRSLVPEPQPLAA